MASRSRALIAVLAAGMMALGSSIACAQPPGDAAKGAAVFDAHCSECHVQEGVGQGPSLAGVVGRKAGGLPDYPYTAAIKASGLVWTAANLDRFLTGPRQLVPGTAMSATVVDPTERRDLIAYLATLKAR